MLSHGARIICPLPLSQTLSLLPLTCSPFPRRCITSVQCRARSVMRAQKSVTISTRTREDGEGDDGDGVEEQKEVEEGIIVEEDEAGFVVGMAATAAGGGMRPNSSHSCSHYTGGGEGGGRTQYQLDEGCDTQWGKTASTARPPAE